MLLVFRVVIAMVCSVAVVSCSAAAVAWKEPGLQLFPNRQCSAVLKTSLQGGFLQLYVQHGQGELTHVADDVTGVVWVNENSLAFSSSPIYGKPGIFLFFCTSPDVPRLTPIVSPVHKSRAYPDGADYFELRAVKGVRLEYLYGDDVDKIDFDTFRSDRNLRSVEITRKAE